MRGWKRTTKPCSAWIFAATLPLAVASAAFAQEQPATPAHHGAGISDVMIIVQLRHAKMWYAAKLKNWPLANYEATRIAATLQRAEDLRPDLPFESDGEVEAVIEAIAAQDETAFDDAFHQLTEACNACHQAADVGFIAIRVPLRASPYSNQVFALR